MQKVRKVPTKFWAEAVNTACYISNKVYSRPGTHKTLYKIWKGKKTNLKHFHEFSSPCYILNDKEPRGKLYAKSVEGVFIDYSSNNRAYRVYNMRTMSVMEAINVKIDNYLLFKDHSR